MANNRIIIALGAALLIWFGMVQLPLAGAQTSQATSTTPTVTARARPEENINVGSGGGSSSSAPAATRGTGSTATLTPEPTLTATRTPDANTVATMTAIAWTPTHTPTPTSTPTLTPTATATITVSDTTTPTGTATTSTSDIANGSFELDTTAWRAGNGITIADLPEIAYDGRRLAVIRGTGNLNDALIQRVSIPANRPILTFRMRVESSESQCTNGDTGLITINGTSVKPYNEIFCSARNSTLYPSQVWAYEQIDLTNYTTASTTTVELAFRLTLKDGTTSSTSAWLIDAISLQPAVVSVPSAGTATPTTTATAGPTPSGTPVINSGFEAGQVGWNFSGNAQAVNNANIATRGTWYGLLGSSGATISQSFTLPVSSPHLAFAMNISANRTTCGIDTAEVQASDGATVISKTFDLCTKNYTPSVVWPLDQLNLTPLAGKPITLTFRLRGDSTTLSVWRIDEITLLASPLTLTPTPTATATSTANPTFTSTATAATATATSTTTATATSTTMVTPTTTGATATITPTSTASATPTVTATPTQTANTQPG